MYGQIFKNFPEYVRIAAGIHPKSQICSDCASGLKKNPNLLGLVNQVSKNANFVRIGPKRAEFDSKWQADVSKHYKMDHSTSSPARLGPKSEIGEQYAYKPLTKQLIIQQNSKFR